MPGTIYQKIVLRGTKTKDLHDLYTDFKKHSIATGVLAKISPKEGGRYSAHHNCIRGKNLRLIKNKLTVQIGGLPVGVKEMPVWLLLFVLSKEEMMQYFTQLMQMFRKMNPAI